MGGHIEYFGNGVSSGCLVGPGMQSVDDHVSPLGIQPSRPMSVCSGSSCGGSGASPVLHSTTSTHSRYGSGSRDDMMTDKVLMSLTVRELNKRLQGCPREEVGEQLLILTCFLHNK